MEIDEENKKLKSLFKNCVFFISREIPNEIFGLTILSSGGVYGDESDNSPFKVDDPRITHFIMDRPAEFISFDKNKEYIQPQWLFDCINSKSLLPVSEYAPGKKLPPHLSPFYEYDEEGVARLKLKKSQSEDEEVEEVTTKDENDSLREMMISKNKKKLLTKIRAEKKKKMSVPKSEKKKIFQY